MCLGLSLGLGLSTPGSAFTQDAIGSVDQSPVSAEWAGSWFPGVESDPDLAALVLDVLENNPDLAAERAAADAARERSPQMGALPDPMLGGTAFLMRPQTRTGPVQGGVMISQKFPWFGKRSLRAQAAETEADAADSRVGMWRLRLVSETRRLYYELCFLNRESEIVREDRATLEHYEELARARYASGVGLEQGVVKIQAEITRAEVRLLDIATRTASLRSTINALRDRPLDNAVRVGPVPKVLEFHADLGSLRAEAHAARPEVTEADRAIDRARLLSRLAGKAYVPDVTIGAFYTFVGERDDPAGRTSPPTGNGDNDLGLTVGINLPIWRGALSSAVEETAYEEVRAREQKRGTLAEIDGQLTDVAARLPLIWERSQLFERVLMIQAEQSLESAESAYAAGASSALDLLDAERVRLEVRIATERARTDYVLALSAVATALGRELSASDSSKEVGK